MPSQIGQLMLDQVCMGGQKGQNKTISNIYIKKPTKDKTTAKEQMFQYKHFCIRLALVFRLFSFDFILIYKFVLLSFRPLFDFIFVFL